tara:strand:+ start:39924 stop:41732 length:1809 start_codon:yes stop_codon:yes gene_type:complete
MLHSPDKKEIHNSELTQTIQTLSNQDLFASVSYEHFLRLSAKEEKIALLLVSDPVVQNVIDGLAISILGSLHGEVASKILSIPALRNKLLGIDLEKLANSSRDVAIEILSAMELKSRLKTYDIAAIGAAHPDLVEMIMQDSSLFGKIEYIHYGKLCQNNMVAAEQLITEKNSYMEGVEIALIAKHHPDLALALIRNKTLRNKLDTESLVILSAASENSAIAILEDSGFYEQLGPIGIARILANYDKLATDFIAQKPKILYDFDKISTACIVENSPDIAIELYNNSAYRSRTQISREHIAWIESAIGVKSEAFMTAIKAPGSALLRTVEKVCVSFMLKNKIDLPSNVKGGVLKGIVAPMLMQMVPEARLQIIHQLVAQVQRMEMDEIVALGNKSIEVADDILLHYKSRLVGEDLVLLGEKSLAIVEKILDNSELCNKMSGFNLVMMCKNHPEACKRILLDKALREKVVGCHAGVLALKDPMLLHLIFGDELIKENLTQKDLPLLCKRYIGVTKQALNDKALQTRFSKFYHALLQNRIAAVEAISQCVRKTVTPEERDKVRPTEMPVCIETQEPLLISNIKSLDLDASILSSQEEEERKLLRHH